MNSRHKSSRRKRRGNEWMGEGERKKESQEKSFLRQKHTQRGKAGGEDENQLPLKSNKNIRIREKHERVFSIRFNDDIL